MSFRYNLKETPFRDRQTKKLLDYLKEDTDGVVHWYFSVKYYDNEKTASLKDFMVNIAQYKPMFYDKISELCSAVYTPKVSSYLKSRLRVWVKVRELSEKSTYHNKRKVKSK